MHPAYDVERSDLQYLKKAIKEAAMNRKPETDKLMKTLYLHTYVCVKSILEKDGAQHIKDIVRTARTAIEMELAEEDVKAFTTIVTVADVLDVLKLSIRWKNTDHLEKIVNCLPEEAKTLAMNLLNHYNVYLDVYDDVVTLRDSLTKDVAAFEVTKTQIAVEVTVDKDTSEFTGKDYKEMLYLLVCVSWMIPRNKILVVEVQSGNSTIIVFLIDKDLTENIIRYSAEASALWAFQELGVTRVRIGEFELNVVHLLAQHFKEALRSGLTGGMDFVGAVKVCA